MNKLYGWIEKGLWASRLITFIGVASSLVLTLAMCTVAILDMVDLAQLAGGYLGASPDTRSSLRLAMVAQAVGIIDSFLIAAVTFLFGMGLYELFISKIDVGGEDQEMAERLLIVTSLDDLKSKVGKMIILILVVKFFQIAMDLKYLASTDLLALAVGTILMSGALYLTYQSGHR
jgi:uncharacterized membrane protein YqhA